MKHQAADPTRLDEWAGRLHTSVKTVRRDLEREFSVSYPRWRTLARLRAPVRCWSWVAHRVGHASPSSFVAASAEEFVPGGWGGQPS